MAIQVQWRRGTTAENDAFTGAVGEITVDTTLSNIRVHDGTTAGGVTPGGFASGTDMLFWQSTAPSGWTRNTTSTYNESGIRVMSSGTWLANSGSANFSSVFVNAAATSNDAADLAAHVHQEKTATSGGGAHTNAFNWSSGSGSDGAAGVATQGTTGSGSQQAINVVSTGAGGGHSHTIDLDIKYIDVIICSKD
jgi:hypothetical protein